MRDKSFRYLLYRGRRNIKHKPSRLRARDGTACIGKLHPGDIVPLERRAIRSQILLAAPFATT
jgi:hypothetical protein